MPETSERVLDRTSVRERVLAMRAQGRTFRAIADAVGLERSRRAFDTFAEAVRQRPPSERAALREQELARLAKLEAHVLADPRLDETAKTWRVETLHRLRAKLLED